MNRIYGLTIEGTSDTEDGTGIVLPKLIDKLSELPKKPVLRICLEFGVSLKNYTRIIATLRGAGYPILLQPIDSEDVHRYSIQGYTHRFVECLEAFSPYIDYLEFANEVNGDWVTDGYEKLSFLLTNFTKPQSIKSVITAYVTDGYESYVEENLITLKPHCLFYSVYPYSETQASTFLSNGKMISSQSLVGVGEYGMENPNGSRGDLSSNLKLIRDFETRKPQTPNDLIGGFYWDFYDDCVEKENDEILSTFIEAWK